MKFILAALLLAFSTSAHAASITITFDHPQAQRSKVYNFPDPQMLTLIDAYREKLVRSGQLPANATNAQVVDAIFAALAREMKYVIREFKRPAIEQQVEADSIDLN